MEKTDVVFVNEIDVMEGSQFPYIGQLILRDILSSKYSCKIVNNKILVKENVIPQSSSVQDIVVLMAKYIAECNPKIVDFYTVCDTFPLTILMANLVREYCPDSTIIFGGPQATLLIEQCLTELKCVDIIGYAEGELMIENLVSTILNHGDLENVLGIAYLHGGKIRINESPKLVPAEKLHDYFIRDFTPYKIEKYSEIRLEGGRGCPFGCTFCSTSLFWKRKARMKPVNDLIEEMKYYTKKYGVRKFGMVHDLFTSNKRYVLLFCEKIQEEGLDIEWTCSARLDTVDSELIEKMAEAKCKAIYIGVETGSAKMQKVLNKNLNLNRIEMIAKACQDNGIGVTYSFIMGFPEETIWDFKETIKLIEKLLQLNNVNDIIQLHMFSPYPSTEETEKVKKLLYFPENRNYLPVIQRNCLFDETEKIIGEFPELCSAYMDFATEVRTRYRCFSNFFEMIVQAKPIFVFSIAYLIEQYGLINIYDKFSDEIEKEVFRIQDKVKAGDNYNRVTLQIVENIVTAYFKDIDGIVNKIYQYECILEKVVLNYKKIFYIIQTDVDLKKTRENLKIVEGNKKYILFGGDLKGELLEIMDAQYENNVIEALENSGYRQMNENIEE